MQLIAGAVAFGTAVGVAVGAGLALLFDWLDARKARGA